MRVLSLILLFCTSSLAQGWEKDLDRAKVMAKAQKKPIFAYVLDEY